MGAAIARSYGVTPKAIRDIWKLKTWADITLTYNSLSSNNANNTIVEDDGIVPSKRLKSKNEFAQQDCDSYGDLFDRTSDPVTSGSVVPEPTDIPSPSPCKGDFGVLPPMTFSRPVRFNTIAPQHIDSITARRKTNLTMELNQPSYYDLYPAVGPNETLEPTDARKEDFGMPPPMTFAPPVRFNALSTQHMDSIIAKRKANLAFYSGVPPLQTASCFGESAMSNQTSVDASSSFSYAAVRGTPDPMCRPNALAPEIHSSADYKLSAADWSADCWMNVTDAEENVPRVEDLGDADAAPSGLEPPDFLYACGPGWNEEVAAAAAADLLAWAAEGEAEGNDGAWLGSCPAATLAAAPVIPTCSFGWQHSRRSPAGTLAGGAIEAPWIEVVGDGDGA